MWKKIVIIKLMPKTIIVIPGQPQQQQYRHPPVDPRYQMLMHPQLQQHHMMMQQQQMAQQQMMVQPLPNFGIGMPFNVWARPNYDYTKMKLYQMVDYSSGWNPNIHDEMLKFHINEVVRKHDCNRNGQMDPCEYHPAYRDLCLRMGLAPPKSFVQLKGTFQRFDTNRDKKLSPMEMFVAFKTIQGVIPDMMQPGLPMF